MAYLPGFKHDIFVSYAHDNNPGAEAGAGGRITRLHRLLEERLRELTGRELDIWRDTTLARNQEFDKTIKQAVEDSGIFLAVNSTAYRNSHYCKQEIEWFRARLQEQRETVAAEAKEHGAFPGLEAGDDGRDPEEQAVRAADDMVEARLAGDRGKLLQKIDLALERLAAGSYDRCARCGGTIPLERLRAKPSVSLCVSCQEEKDAGPEDGSA